MKKCLNCGTECKDEAHFCLACGKEFPVTAPEGRICPKCKKQSSPTAKFCRHCGFALNETPPSDTKTPQNDSQAGGIEKDLQAEFSVRDNYISWQILPGQLAVKIDETEMEKYEKIKGVYVAPGIVALFFLNGKFAAALESGSYAFKDVNKEPIPHSTHNNKVVAFLQNIGAHIADGVTRLFKNLQQGKHNYYTIVLIRKAAFSLVYEMKNITTAALRSDVGLHIHCKISNLNDFFENQMVDKRFVSLESLADSLQVIVKNVLSHTLAAEEPKHIENNESLKQAVRENLNEQLKAACSYISVSHVVELSVSHEALSHIRDLKEELYIAEQELEQLQLRNEFMNRMQNEEYSNQLRAARSRVDFEVLMDRIDKDDMLNKDQKAKFVEMLEAESQLRKATTQIETENAIDKLRQSRMLSEEELLRLKATIENRLNLQQLENMQILTMATLRNERDLDAEKLKWELEVGNKRFENQLNRQKAQDNYQDERREADLRFQAKKEQSRLDQLQQLMQMNQAKKDAEHRRAMTEREFDLKAEDARNRVKLEETKIYATMTAEQIMAANPNITPQAAQALAKKYEAEAIAAQNNSTTDLLNRHVEDWKQMVKDQMTLTRDVLGAQMHANEKEIANKQAELDRVHADAERSQDRLLSGVETTVNAVSKMGMHPTPTANTQTPPPANHDNVFYCPNCGKLVNKTALACDFCGEIL